MDIIPHILSEDMVKDLTDEHLQMLVTCTTERLMKFIRQYIKDGTADKGVQDRIRSAYEYVIRRDEFLASDVTKKYSDMLINTDYSMLSVAMPVEELKELITAIDYITNSIYAVPYISSVTNSNCNRLRCVLTEYVKEPHPGAAAFLGKLKKYGKLFKDGALEQNTGTVVKRVVRNLQTYEIMRRGLLFIYKRKS